MLQEIEIHKSIEHEHIVKFYSFFEDKNFIYIILELCDKKSMMELHKRRKTITEPEIRYFVRQIAHACLYLHENQIIHRDLKLGNIFINNDMKCKLGDFGLATRVGDAERKFTFCGTPNYLAPEILAKTGHSYQVDVWALGCIVYTLAVGTPPFETPDINTTYERIKENSFQIPATVDRNLSRFIESMLKANPKERPTMTSILKDPYLTGSYVPRSLPESCLTTAPRSHTGRLSILPDALDKLALHSQNDLNALRPPLQLVTNTDIAEEKAISGPVTRRRSNENKNMQIATGSAALAQNDQALRKRPYPGPNNQDDPNLVKLIKQLSEIVDGTQKIRSRAVIEPEIEDPKSGPIHWISKWVDFSDKYGLGYALCDGSYGVRFNDNSTLIMLASEDESLQYIEATGEEYFFLKKNTPEGNMKKKVELLRYFSSYMAKYLASTGKSVAGGEGMSRQIYVKDWYRTKSALVFHLTNGILQVHFFDHVKVVCCPVMGAATFFDETGQVNTYRFDLIASYGATSSIYKRLAYALNSAHYFLQQNKSNDVCATAMTKKSGLDALESKAATKAVA